jgi:signal transduction histidine kinase/DNA-binding response OmpR family regulator
MPLLPDFRLGQLARRPPRALLVLYLLIGVVPVILGAADGAVVLNLRESLLRNAERNLATTSLTLAEQADRSIQSLDLILSGLTEYVRAAGVTDGASYQSRMSGYATQLMLNEKLRGLPMINALTMISAEGKLINFSRYWPIPAVDVTDRDYFQALKDDPARTSFLGVPVQNRGDGTWTVYLARRLNGPDGNFVGLLLGAIELRYFEDFYRSISHGDGDTVSLQRADGVLLVRYPTTDAIGTTLPVSGIRTLAGASSGTARDLSSVDGTMRIKAARMLTNYPMLVQTTMTEEAVLRGWRSVALVLTLITGGCALSIAMAAFAIGRWWKQQQSLVHAQAERTEADKARAVAKTDLLRERERHAEEANRAKSGFLAMMSHEIRTPMNAVLGLAGTLLDETLQPQQRKVVQAIRDSGDDLLRILNDILDFSKLEAGRMTFEALVFSPDALGHNVVSILEPRAAAKKLALSIHSDPALPQALLGDAGRIRQVLLNLVSNAVKFTEAGKVTIETRCTARDANTATIEWLVRDTGIGIPPDNLGKLFGEFAQADGSITRRFGGSGLGLAISKRLVEQMGGGIAVDSAPGKGTLFRFHLSLPTAAMPALPAPPKHNAAEALRNALAALGRPLRVLLAEDSPTNQFVVMQLLKSFDVHVDVVGDGLEAVAAASRFGYDLIYMDMRMPEMDGLQATHEIRRGGERSAGIPIIAFTANAFPEDVKACMDAGMDDFVAKPVQKEVFLNATAQALAKRRPDGGETAGPMPPPHAAAEVPAIDRQAVAALIDTLGTEIVAVMTAVFVEETVDRFTRMQDGSLDAAALQREAHTLKGAAGTAGAARLAGLAAAIEQGLRAGTAIEPPDVAGLRAAFDAYRSALADLDLVPASAAA